MDMQIKKLEPTLVKILKKNGVVKAGIFGSYARGEAKRRSDIDILVQFKKGKGFFDLVRLENELKSKLQRDVDLLTYNSVHHLLKKRILDDEVRIL